MTGQETTEEIVSAVTERDTASFGELLEPCGPEAIGDLTFSPRRNLLLWHGVSAAFCEALTAAGKRILPVPTESLVYLVDGGFMCLPVAKHARFCQVPIEQRATRKERHYGRVSEGVSRKTAAMAFAGPE
jgi:hypothetical protein